MNNIHYNIHDKYYKTCEFINLNKVIETTFCMRERERERTNKVSIAKVSWNCIMSLLDHVKNSFLDGVNAPCIPCNLIPMGGPGCSHFRVQPGPLEYQIGSPFFQSQTWYEYTSTTILNLTTHLWILNINHFITILVVTRLGWNWSNN